MTEDDYLRQLQALLPQGYAWPRDEDAVLTRLLAALAVECARVDLRGDELINEADPRTTSELLTDWERVAGLPDACLTIGQQTIQQRRAALVSKLTSIGGQSRQYFIAVAASLGYPGATVTEFRPMNCNDDCNDVLHSDADRFAWRINLPNSNAGTFLANCNSTCNDALGAWGDKILECRINNLKPAHTTALFAYI